MSLSWLFPIGAVGLLALGAIVLLHMRHRMPSVMPFPQLAFWPRVPSESRESPRWRRPPISLLLVLQLLAALLIALAFMRPAMPGLGGVIGQRADAVQHVIVLDGSTSMLARAEDGQSRWDAARAEVNELLDEWQQGDGVTLVVASANPTWKRAVDESQVAELRAWLADMPVPGGVPDPQAVSSLINGSLLPDLAPDISVVTDGGLVLDDDNGAASVVLVSGENRSPGNVAIVGTTVTSRDSGGDRVVRATVLHDRSETETLPWVARSGESDIATGTITLAPGASGEVDVRIPDGVQDVTISLVVDDALPEDDHTTVSFGGDALTDLSVVLISDVPGPTRRALEVLPGAQVEIYPSTTPGISDIAANSDLVVYDATAPTPDDLPNVPMLLVQPTGLADAWQISEVAPNPQLGDVRLDHPVMRDVALEGVVFGETPIYVLPEEADVIAVGTDAGSTVPLIWTDDLEGQRYVAFAFDPSRSNIADRVSFPVLIGQTVDLLTGAGSGGAVAPGEVAAFEVPGEVRQVEVVDPEGRRSFISVPGSDDASQTVRLPVMAVPGRWEILLRDSSDFQIDSGAMVVNVGSQLESGLRQADVSTLSLRDGSGASGTASSDSAGALVELWPLLVLAGIAVVCLEWWVWLGRSVRARHAPGEARP